jgi:BirA family biotin operon repressor/biotin-[acetyl-CoA-carboxylase] ligase
VLSLALRDAVLTAAGLHDSDLLRLKWPNDLMAENRKTAGLLLEGGQQRGKTFVVAGFGVNIVSHPEGTAHPATHLRAAGLDAERDGLLAALSGAAVRRLDQWQRGENFAEIRRDWLAVAYGLGQGLRVATLGESFEATFEGIDLAGRLIAGTPAGRRLVNAGEVFPLGPATGERAA